jgi:hypothetical protein
MRTDEGTKGRCSKAYTVYLRLFTVSVILFSHAHFTHACHMSEPKRPMPLDEFKRRLGSLAEGLTDEQLIDLRKDTYRLSDAIIDWWLRYRHRRKGDPNSTPSP